MLNSLFSGCPLGELFNAENMQEVGHCLEKNSPSLADTEIPKY